MGNLFGRLCRQALLAEHRESSSETEAPLRITMRRRSPLSIRYSVRPKTAAWGNGGWAERTSSISRGYTFSRR